MIQTPMTNRLTLPLLLMGTGLAVGAERTNVVLILIDDMGWRDVACCGNAAFATPNIDRLAAQGMRFTNAYAPCTVCSPSRAAILTGRYPARLHVTDWIPGHDAPNGRMRIPDWTKHLPLEEATIAKTLKAAGYATALFGKWHLGDEGFEPEKQGFDLNLGGCRFGQPPSYFSPYRIPNLTDGAKGEYLTDRLAAETDRFITANKDRPFFVYLANYAVHSPFQAKADDIAAGVQRGLAPKGRANATYAAMVKSVDDGVGRVLRRLDELGLAQRTMVIFTSDNGGVASVSDNAPLRAGKGTNYDGGVRVPCIVRWPGVAAPATVSEVPMVGVDLYPTICAATGVADAPGHRSDGLDLSPLLRGSGTIDRTALFWHYPHYHPHGATPHGAVRVGDLRLVERYEDGGAELYDLKQDAGETRDLAAERPEDVQHLRALLADWRREVGAQMPTPNPAFDPARPTWGGRHKPAQDP